MVARLGIYFFITFLVALGFLFVPQLNIVGKHGLSLWHEMQVTQDYRDGILRFAVQTLFFFFALMFLFGLKGKKKEARSDRQQPVDEHKSTTDF